MSTFILITVPVVIEIHFGSNLSLFGSEIFDSIYGWGVCCRLNALCTKQLWEPLQAKLHHDWLAAPVLFEVGIICLETCFTLASHSLMPSLRHVQLPKWCEEEELLSKHILTFVWFKSNLTLIQAAISQISVKLQHWTLKRSQPPSVDELCVYMWHIHSVPLCALRTLPLITQSI